MFLFFVALHEKKQWFAQAFLCSGALVSMSTPLKALSLEGRNTLLYIYYIKYSEKVTSKMVRWKDNEYWNLFTFSLLNRKNFPSCFYDTFQNLQSKILKKICKIKTFNHAFHHGKNRDYIFQAYPYKVDELM